MTTKNNYLHDAAMQADKDATELSEFSEGVPVDPDVAEHMGAFEEVALLFADIDKPIDHDLLAKTIKEVGIKDHDV
ncbi:hypothetical protein [Halodesulfovibrio sp.]|jgi:hypothetical protein|uniref:hypothetical protein n=1 Tax=Halodesulfovibrio sp. TaxID=1912772 RepID=UPI0025D5D9BE|nr:hypothetical protein [Halodesulfovibrio sp.]MCT4533771.1 hypothetical protein [Halodesulfovibrio sp.]MCT4625670.1 hypothetical protein [Halodesulfovibrio sp.]